MKHCCQGIEVHQSESILQKGADVYINFSSQAGNLVTLLLLVLRYHLEKPDNHS